jgi:hypothetical protein
MSSICPPPIPTLVGHGHSGKSTLYHVISLCICIRFLVKNIRLLQNVLKTATMIQAHQFITELQWLYAASNNLKSSWTSQMLSKMRWWHPHPPLCLQRTGYSGPTACKSPLPWLSDCAWWLFTSSNMSPSNKCCSRCSSHSHLSIMKGPSLLWHKVKNWTFDIFFDIIICFFQLNCSTSTMPWL